MIRVVVTGMNIISSLGLDLETNWNNLVAGKSGVRKISLLMLLQILPVSLLKYLQNSRNSQRSILKNGQVAR